MTNKEKIGAFVALFAACVGLAGPSIAGPGRPSAASEISWGRQDMARGHWTGALSHFRKALAREPRRTDAYVGLAGAYKRLGDIQRARESFAAALKINPHNDQAETGLHDVMTPEQHERMMAEIEANVKNAPLDADLQTTYAEELFERNRFDEAEKAAQTALSLNGKESHAEGVLGLIAAQRNRKEDAIRLLEAATKADDSDDDSWAGLGDIYMSEKNYPRAVASYAQAVKAAPDHAEWHEKLGSAYVATGNQEAASQEAEFVRKIHADTDVAQKVPGTP